LKARSGHGFQRALGRALGHGEALDHIIKGDAGMTRRHQSSLPTLAACAASGTLSQYKELAGDNIQYDASEKRYLPTASFRAWFMKPSADRYLSVPPAVAGARPQSSVVRASMFRKGLLRYTHAVGPGVDGQSADSLADGFFATALGGIA
jgi:hypothetical protein